MLKQGFNIAWTFFKVVLVLLSPVIAYFFIFALLCLVWFLIYKYYHDWELPASGVRKVERRPLLKQLFYDAPRRYVRDMYEREPDFFDPHGIHIFCGEQGSGKTIGIVEMIMLLHRMYPKAKVITNFKLKTQNDELTDWRQLLNYSNGHQGVIVGIDEIQNWFMSGKNQLPIEMLEIVTQNRKNRRIICCTSQVFTRVNKALREQVTFVYEPHTFFKCFTVVFKKKYLFDAEGNLAGSKLKKVYCFTHTDEMRNSYDTYHVIHTLAQEGFKDLPPASVTNVYVDSTARRK